MIECDICCFDFSDSRIPKVLTKCGHSFCEVCIKSMIHQNDTVECPHCRVTTPFKDVKTNYALSTHMTSSNGAEETSLHPLCAFHSSNPVRVFCVTCWLFVCQDCFETQGSAHCSHIRVSLTEGVGLVRTEMKEVSERSKSIHAYQQEKENGERKKYECISQKCHLNVAQSIQTYQQIVARLQGELDIAVEQIKEYTVLMKGRLDHEERVHGMLARVESLTNGTDDTDMWEYLKWRHSICHALSLAESDYRNVHDELDRIRIDNREEATEIDGEKIPEIEIFLPLGPLIKVQGLGIRIDDSPRKDPILHRSTSNGELVP